MPTRSTSASSSILKIEHAPGLYVLEPDFGASSNSQHANYDVAKGEQLIYDVYRALRDGPGWNDTLLIITHDEHGGNYDHIAPPDTATAPDASIGEFDNFDFKRLGVRIPALLISPRIAAGTVYRPNRRAAIGCESAETGRAERSRAHSCLARFDAADTRRNGASRSRPAAVGHECANRRIHSRAHGRVGRPSAQAQGAMTARLFV